jgi:hypothetical protein
MPALKLTILDRTSTRKYARLLDPVWWLEVALLRLDDHGGSQFRITRHADSRNLFSVSSIIYIWDIALRRKGAREKAQIPYIPPHF